MTGAMVSRTLRHLRESPPIKRKIRALAHELRVSGGTIVNWEKQEKGPNLTYAILERYEKRYGIPVSLTLCIAQLAAAAHEEAATGKAGKLEALASYMQILVGRVFLLGDQAGRDPLPTAYTGNAELVRMALIDDLMNTVRAHIKGREAKRKMFQKIDKDERIRP
jgi:transcriptional regulator with XRE-family HTH domain